MRMQEYEKAHGGVVWHLDCFDLSPLDEQLYMALTFPAQLVLAPFGKLNQRDLNCAWPHDFSHSQLILIAICMCVFWWCVGWLWEQERSFPIGVSGPSRVLRGVLRIVLALFFLAGLAGLLFLLLYDRSDLVMKAPAFFIVLAWTSLALLLLRKGGTAGREAASVERPS